MQLSDNMLMVQNSKDEDFIVWLMYKRIDFIPKWELGILEKMITERCDKMNLTFQWGCCGTNVIRSKDDER